MMPEEWDAVLAKRISRACDEAEHPRGMSPHDGKVHLDASVVRRLLSAALRERESAKEVERLRWKWRQYVKSCDDVGLPGALSYDQWISAIDAALATEKNESGQGEQT